MALRDVVLTVTDEVIPTGDRSRFELALIVVLYALTNETGTIPDDCFRSDEELAVVASLSAWELRIAAALWMRHVERQAEDPHVRSAATRLAIVWERRASDYRSHCRPVARTARVRSRPRTRRRSRAPARSRGRRSSADDGDPEPDLAITSVSAFRRHVLAWLVGRL
jgi:hypothetical protein